jgi:uncharacterized protein (UPF0333 family)
VAPYTAFPYPNKSGRCGMMHTSYASIEIFKREFQLPTLFLFQPRQSIIMNAQTAFEYMVIAIFILAFLTPIWIYLAQLQSQTSDEFALSYAKNAVNQIAKKADLVYSQRMEAKVKIGVYIPRGVEEINITGNEINIRIRSMSGSVDVFATSIAQLQGSLPTDEGLYWVLIKAEGDYVNVTLA